MTVLPNTLPLIIVGLLLALLQTGCFLTPTREINMRVTRTDAGGSEVTVTYRMRPPKPGQVYVLWIANPDEGKQVRVGALQPSTRLRAITTRVGFWATSAVVSIESSSDVTRMSDTWELCSGARCSGGATTFTGQT